jgi:hypothetical protein
MVEISFSLVEKSRRSREAGAELAGKRQVTGDRRPLCVITNRPGPYYLIGLKCKRSAFAPDRFLSPRVSATRLFAARLLADLGVRMRVRKKKRRDAAERKDEIRPACPNI